MNRITRNYLFMTVFQALSRIGGLLWTILVARHLGDIGFGKISFAISFCAIFGILIEFGLSTLTVREVARSKEEADRFTNNIAAMKSILSLLVAGLIGVIIWALNYPADTRLAVHIVTITVVLNALTSIVTSLFYAFERMEYPSIMTCAAKVLSLAATVLFIKLNLGLAWIALTLVAESLVSLMGISISWRRVFKPRFRFEFDFGFWSHLLKNALPFALAMLCGLVYFKIDVVLLSLLKGDAIVGWYSAGYRLMEGLIFIAGAFVNTVFPVLSRHYIISERILTESIEKSFRFLLSIGLPIAVGLCVVADKLVNTFYGPAFVNSITVLRITAFALLFVFMNYLSGVILGAINKQHLHFLATLVAVVVNIGLNLTLIPSLGHVGAGIACTVTQAVLFCVYVYMILKHLSVPVKLVFVARILASGLCMGLVVLLFHRLPLAPSILIGCAVYPGCLLLFRAFSREDLALILRALNIRQPSTE